MQIVENGLTVDIYRNLRLTGPFMEYNDEDVKVALKHTLYSVVIFDGELPIGIARLVGDNRITFFIKDVVVHPEYRGKGIGRLLMQQIFKYIEAHACHNAYIGLNSTVGMEPFYEKFGFIRRPNDGQGSGMTMYYKKQNRGEHHEEDCRIWQYQHRFSDRNRSYSTKR